MSIPSRNSDENFPILAVWDTHIHVWDNTQHDCDMQKDDYSIDNHLFLVYAILDVFS